MAVVRIVVAVVLAVIGVIAIGTDCGVVIVTGGCPVMAVSSVDVTPVVADWQWMRPHVVIGVEVDV
jgi:hypothetical protein